MKLWSVADTTRGNPLIAVWIFVYICIISDEYVLNFCVFPVLGTKPGPHQELVGCCVAVELGRAVDGRCLVGT